MRASAPAPGWREARSSRTEPLKLLPTFLYACTYEPTFLRVYTEHLDKRGVPAPEPGWRAQYQRYIGDTCWLGKGEILIREAAVAS